MCSIVACPSECADHAQPVGGCAVGRSLEQLEREICELAGKLAAATCRWLLLVAEFDKRAGWAEWGVRSCAHWLSWRCSIGLHTAREQVRVARRLEEMPLVRSAFEAGELSYCKVRALTRVTTPEMEATLVETARHATGAQLEKLVRGYRGALSATLDGAARAHERRRLTWCWEDDGSLRFGGCLPAEEGALLLAALSAVQAPDAASPPASQADALVEISRLAVDGAGAARDDGDPWQLVVHVDAGTLASDQVRQRCELADGPALCPETARRLGCDAGVLAIIERDGRPLSVGRRKRTISAPMRRALRARDQGCRFPGCTHGRFLHAHHIHHWARGGPTVLGNLVQLCSFHHRLVHEGGFQVERAGPGGVRFRRPDGRVIHAAPVSRRARRGGREGEALGCGARIAADTCRPLSAGDRLEYDHAVMVLAAQALRARAVAGT